MADAPKLLGSDTLRKAYPKINSSIDNANEALTKSVEANATADSAVTTANSAVTTANEANDKSDFTQTQLDEVVGAGTIDPAVEQMKVDLEGVSHPSPDARLRSELQKRDTQLAETAKYSLNNLRPTIKGKKCMAVFVSDDAMRQELTINAPTFIEKGVPYTIAVPPNLPGNLAIDYPEDLKRLQDVNGFEIVSHTYNHINLSTLTTEEEIEYELVESQNWLKENGYKGWDILVYPQGGNNELVRKVARKYYKMAIGTLPNNGINEYPLRTFDIARVGLGSYFNTNEAGAIYQDARFPADGSSLEYYKARVDFAKQNGQILIWMLHPWHADHTETQQQHIRDLIDYTKAQGIPIVTLKEALNTVGNTIDVGDYHYNTTGKEYFATGANGVTRSSQIGYEIQSLNKYTLDTPLSSYPFGTTVTPISTAAATNATRKPVDLGGNLITHRSFISNDLSYQEYQASNGRVYRTTASGTGTWGAWLNPTRYKSVDVTVSATIPAKSTYNYVVSNSGILHQDVVTAFPVTNIETGITYTTFVTGAGDVVIRLANITDASITMASKAWRINAVSVL